VQFGPFQSLAEPEDCFVDRNREFDAELRAHSSGVDVHLARVMQIYIWISGRGLCKAAESYRSL